MNTMSIGRETSLKKGPPDAGRGGAKWRRRCDESSLKYN